MIIGFLSDAHGNPAGLATCLDLLRREGAGEVFFLGDAVGYWPHGVRVLEMLAEAGVRCLRGNHEAMLLGRLRTVDPKEELYRLRPLAGELPSSLRRMVAESWRERIILERDGRRLLLIHGRPRDPLEGYLYEDQETSPGEGEGFDLVAMGHTHRPFIRRQKEVIWLNAGSCGLPRDNRRLASCALYDSGSHQARLLAAPLDIGGLLASCPPRSVSDRLVAYVRGDPGAAEVAT